MYDYQNKELYDEVHAIMGRELLTFFKQALQGIEAEVPYNYYGNRGNVDLIWYHSSNRTGQILRIFELESKIPRLGELIRKLKDRIEYFPAYFMQNRGLSKLKRVELFLVLLSTRENWQIVNEYLPNFKSAFVRTYQVFPKDIISDTKNPNDDRFQWLVKRFSLVFFDPLKAREVDINEGITIQDETLPFHRMRAFWMIDDWSAPLDKIHSSLRSIEPTFQSSREFLNRYKAYLKS